MTQHKQKMEPAPPVPGTPQPPVQCVESPTGFHVIDPATGKCKHCGGFWRDLFNGIGEAIGNAKFGE
jgi:hypothetical protein